MRKRVYLAILLSGLAGLPMSLVAQSGSSITGKIIAKSDGQPLAGATITSKSGKSVIKADKDGNYTINAQSGDFLIIKNVGYLSREIPLTGNGFQLIELEADITKLDEVVVTGLASGVKRSNLANAVTSLNAKDITGTVPPQTVDNTLFGKLPGANVRINSGAPGGGVSIQLRGISTLQGASQPLYIIDGVYLNNNTLQTGRSAVSGAGATNQDDAANRIADLNPEDIENIEILKGSSASAIYGTRANAGVIIITTKKGKAGRTKISFEQDAGFATIQRYMGSAPWDEQKINTYFPESRRQIELERLKGAQGKTYDFEKIFFGETPLLLASKLSLSGGNERTQFFVSGALNKEDGIMKNTGFDRRSIRANIDHKLNDRVSFSLNSNYLNSNTDRGFTGNQNNTGASIGYNIAYLPNYYNPFPDEQGNYPDSPYSLAQNPLAVRDKGINNVKINRVIEAASLKVKLFENSNSSLDFAAQGGIDFLSSNSLIYLPEDLQYQRNQANPGDVIIGRENNFNGNFQAFLVHKLNSGGFSFHTQVGSVYLTTERNLLFNRGRGLIAGQKNLTQAAVQSVYQHYDEKVKDYGVVAQHELNYKDIVIGTVGVRFDKSTLNGDANKFYVFPKASLATNLAKLPGWQSETVSQLKLRGAYGQTGGLASFGATYTALSPTVIGGLVGSQLSSVAGNRAIKPERAGELELGADIGFFNNRLLLEATWYNKNVSDLIQDLNLAGASGISTKKVNAADLRNRGVELALSGTPVQQENIRWSSRVLFWSNRTKITRLDVPSYLSGSYGATFGTYLYKEGYSPTTIVGNPQISPGVYTVWGDSQPDFQSSWFNDITLYKNFSLSFLLHWKKGGDVLNITLYNTDNGGTTKDWNEDYNNDGVPNGKDRPGKGTAGVYVQNADFVRLREAGLSYTIPKAYLKQVTKGKIENIRLGVSANNLFTFTKYKGYDPEASNFGTTAINTGTDLFQYPSSKRILFQLKVDF